MHHTYDIRIKEFTPLIPPKILKQEIPISSKIEDRVLSGRKSIEKIIQKKDKRMLVIVGPCSIHDPEAALDYAEKLSSFKSKVEDSLFVVMRVYFEKPRTSTGWKGLINDPCLDGSCDMIEGIKNARKLLIAINAMGLPVATEILDPIIPQYIAGLVSWAAIGARTTESQTHREMASGLSMPVGLKNATDGSYNAAINAMLAAKTPHSFLGIDPDGRTAIVKTTGNTMGHLVLRGGDNRPNYDPISIEDAVNQLKKNDLNEALMVDCSHANCGKKHKGQLFVWKSVLEQRIAGNNNIIGLMLESNLKEGKQKIPQDLSRLEYGISITDECISWETTKELLLYAHNKLRNGEEITS